MEQALLNSTLINEFRNIGENLAEPTGAKHWGVCFDYALEQFEIKKECDGSCWTAFREVKEKFEQISFDQVEAGDMVVYHEYRGNHIDPWRGQPDTDIWGEIEHFGIVFEKRADYQSTLIKSQWGWSRMYIHDLGAVPEMYGNRVSFWRHKENKKARDVAQRGNV
jgi:hypothetical protein